MAFAFTRTAVLLALALGTARARAETANTTGNANADAKKDAPSPLEVRTWGPHAGFRVAVTPGVAFAAKNARVGFNLGMEGTLGFELGPIVLAGGLAAQILVPPGTSILMGFPELKIIVPIGDFALFAVGGAGLGADANTGNAGLAVRLGAGTQWVFNDALALVLDGAYHVANGAPIASIELGPKVSF